MDSKTTRELTITSVLVAVLGVVLYVNLVQAPQKKAASEPPPAPAAHGAAPSSAPAPQPTHSGSPATPKPAQSDMFDLGIDIAKLGPRDETAIQQQQKVLEAEWGRDPFFSLNVGVTSRKGKLTLRGISWSGSGRALAMINDEILVEGETIEGSTIIAIEKDRVTLEQDGREYYLILEEEEVDEGTLKSKKKERRRP
ncbi:MAG: hypothetical protein JW844_00150 [Candidatus Omnitrophica bacterium]|nr:hypothetical protein [Candidatus Omnitrophota bacterium]